MKNIFLALLCLLFFGCHKQKQFHFPIGSWELKAFYYDAINYKENTSELSNIDISYSGTNKIEFMSDKGTEIFTIQKEDLFSKNNKNYISLSLKNKKLKTFLFEYELINDSIIVGDYWIKGQAYKTFDAPNIAVVNHKYYMSGKLYSESGRYEQLGYFSKK